MIGQDRRSDNSYDFRAKADEPGIVGYAATFNRVDSYGTAFAPSSFAKTLSERRDEIRVLYNHNPDINFGVLNTIETDAKGLRIDAHIIDDDSDGTVFMKRLHGGVGFGLSFGFRTMQDRAATQDDNLDMTQVFDIMKWDGIRIITEVMLYEVSPVTFASNHDAAITSIRAQAHADALRVLLDDITDNRLSDPERALMAQIVAAFPEVPDGSAAPHPERMARRFDAEIAMARMRYLTPEVMGQTA